MSIFSASPTSCTRVSRPRGGFVLWVEMPIRCDALQLYERAKKVGSSIAPRQIFSIEGKFHHCIRLNAALWDEAVEAGVATLGRLAEQLLQEGLSR